MDAALRVLKATGRRFVMQVHDELVYVVPDAQVDPFRALLKAEMKAPPEWAPDVPLDAKVGVGKTYGDAK
jgi:DNA polymerase-1